MNPPAQTAQTPSPAMDPKQQVVQQIKGATNVLITVSSNPSVDQLAAAIGTTLVLNKLGKHATAVFSGQTPSTIEFLHPEKTFEKTTDSLRDFIIALDKSKADKLRYKIEDKFVKIFITPYHTSLNQKDLVFSQGDFNVDVVLALGVKKRDELDQAIMAQGRILHDAAVISVNTIAGADLGTINLNMPSASSLSEIMVSLVEIIQPEGKTVYDKQIATAFLTGVVAETARFSNAKTTPQTMSVAAKLMNSGANQQLIATKLDEPQPLTPTPPPQTNNSVVVPHGTTSAPPVVNPPKPQPNPTATLPPVMPDMKTANIPMHQAPKPQISPVTLAPKKPAPPGPPTPPDALPTVAKPSSSDGSMQIPHESLGPVNILDDEPEEEIDKIEKIHIDDKGTLKLESEIQAQQSKNVEPTVEAQPEPVASQPEPKAEPVAAQPQPKVEPTVNQTERKIVGQTNVTGNINVVEDQTEQPSGMPAVNSASSQTMTHDSGNSSQSAPSVTPTATPPSTPPQSSATPDDITLADIEKVVKKPKIDARIKDVKTGGTLGVEPDYPEQVVDKNKGLPPDKTSGTTNPGGPPPLPPPLPPIEMAQPPPQNPADPNSGVPM